MSDWQPIETAPKDGTPIIVAFHGHGEDRVSIVSYSSGIGRHAWDYINSHDGQPQWWMPLPAPPHGMNGPHCECDGCIEKHAEQASPGKL